MTRSERSPLCRPSIYGCRYIYDGIGGGGVLVEDSVVMIKSTGDGNATVRSGSDTKRPEGVSTSLDCAGIGRTTLHSIRF